MLGLQHSPLRRFSLRQPGATYRRRLRPHPGKPRKHVPGNKKNIPVHQLPEHPRSRCFRSLPFPRASAAGTTVWRGVESGNRRKPWSQSSGAFEKHLLHLLPSSSSGRRTYEKKRLASYNVQRFHSMFLSQAVATSFVNNKRANLTDNRQALARRLHPVHRPTTVSPCAYALVHFESIATKSAQNASALSTTSSKDAVHLSAPLTTSRNRHCARHRKPSPCIRVCSKRGSNSPPTHQRLPLQSAPS